jgi:hypothetical protein
VDEHRRAASPSSQQGNCIEVSAWFTSSHSTQQGNCIEVAADEALVLARDSKDPDGPVLGLAPRVWRALIADVKSGRLDLS